MNDLTIIVTEDPVLAAIPAALRDWSAAGLIRPFVWMPPPGAGLRGAEARLVEAGEVTVWSPGDLLARRSPHHVRVVALTSDLATGVASTRAAEGVLAGVSAAGGEIRTTKLHLVLTRLGVRVGELTGIEGWHNLLISPDDAAGPTRPHNTLEGAASGEDLARYALPAVAVLGALFDSQDAGPLDQQAPPPGRQFRVLRAFARHLDGTDVHEALQRQALGLADGYPLVLEGGTTPATYIENIDHANQQMSDAVWARHQDVYLSARRRPEKASVEDLGFFKAFRMLWSFLWAALKNAPAAWADKVIYTAKYRFASAATGAIFGQNSAFAVVVGGVRGGPGSSWENQIQALANIENSLPQAEGHQVHARLDGLWMDVVAGGLTLLDGQARGGLEAPRIGMETGVLRFGRMLAPSRASDSFTEIPGAVRAAVPNDSLAPYDTMSVNRFGRAVSAIAADPLAGAEATSTLESFSGWWQRMRTTYTAKVAQRLSSEFEARLAEIAEYTKILEAAAATSGLPEEIRRQQVRLAKRLRWLLIGLVLLVAATVTLGVLALIGWVVVAIAVTVWILCWLLGSVLTFMRAQAKLFQLKNARAEALSKAAAAEFNLAAAIRDARRCGDAYRLLQHWAEVLALFAGDPLGRGGTQAVESRTPGTDHPLAIQFGKALVNDAAIARTAVELRRQVFPVGWLDPVWDTYLRSSGNLIGTRGSVLLDDPRLLYKQRAVQEDVLLPMWVDALGAQGVPGRAGDQLWQQIVSLLHGPGRERLDQLLATVRVETGASTSLGEFLGGLTARVTTPTMFPSQLFSASGVTGGMPTPLAPWLQERVDGLSRTVVLVQFSDAMAPEFLRSDMPILPDPVPPPIPLPDDEFSRSAVPPRASAPPVRPALGNSTF